MGSTDVYNSSDAAGILNHALESTNNDAIIITIVLIVGIAFLLIPICWFVHHARKDYRTAEHEDRKMILDVINRNSEAFGDLKTSLIENNATQNELLKNINNNASDNKELLVALNAKQDSINDKVDRVIDEYDGFKEVVMKTNNKLNAIIKTEDDTHNKVEKIMESTNSTKNTKTKSKKND